MDTLYLVKDPWRMNSTSEQARLAETNRILLEKFGRVGSLLEIGCGEGHQSIHLQKICDRLTGLDISAKAVNRARIRCPGGRFFVGDPFCHEITSRAPFDLVVACEILYYMSDLSSALAQIRALAHNGLVTYYARMMEELDLQVLSLPATSTEIFECDGTCWRAVWWYDK